MSSARPKDPVLPVVLLLFAAALIAALYYWYTHERQPALDSVTFTTPPVATAPAEPPIRHPIQRPQAEPAKPLPPLADSDEAARDAAGGFIDKQLLDRLFNLSSVVRRFVVTVDNLPRPKIPQRYNIAKPVAGQFLFDGKGDAVTISPANYRRYTAYVRLAETIDTQQMVSAYVYFYPLLQEEYQNLGYPKKYFNDRVIEAIDDLLAAPEVAQPVELLRPKVNYEFADSELERLSAGQKIMIRMGSDNAARVKAKLREIRRELASAQKH